MIRLDAAGTAGHPLEAVNGVRLHSNDLRIS
jgi:hypothetical protein